MNSDGSRPSLRTAVLVLLFVSGALAAGPGIYDFSLVGADGKEVRLDTYKGKVLLIVNLASESSFSGQTGQLEKLYETYRDKGLVVLGIPSNDFGATEPGSDDDVRKRYTQTLHLAFPVFSRISVRGKDVAPLYDFLCDAKEHPTTGGPVHWGFTKFLVDRAGNVFARFEPDVTPEAPELIAALEEAADAKGAEKPKKDDEKDKPGPRKSRRDAARDPRDDDANRQAE